MGDASVTIAIADLHLDQFMRDERAIDLGHHRPDAERRRRRTLLGDAPADPGGWEDVARRFDDLGLPIPATYARYRAGEAHVTGGDRAAAAVPLRAAPVLAATL